MHLVNKKGSSIVQVVVAAGLMAIITTGIMSAINSAGNMQQGISAKDHLREMTSEIRTVLSNPTACINSFGGANLTNSVLTFNNIRDSANNNKFSSGSSYFNGKVKFKNAIIRDFVADAATPNVGFAKLFIYAEKPKPGQGVAEIHSILSLKIRKDVANLILECFSSSSSADSVWSLASLNTNNIYFDSGFVGIGADNPTSVLDVTKNFLGATNTVADKVLKVQGANTPDSNYVLAEFSHGAFPQFTVLANGNVGVGTSSPSHKLDVISNSANYVRSGNLSNNQGGFFATKSTSAGMASFSLAQDDVASRAWRFSLPWTVDVQDRSSITYYDGVDEREFVTFKSNGNVGIGTTNPQANIDVRGLSIFQQNGPGISAVVRGALASDSNLILQSNTNLGTAFWLTATTSNYLMIGGNGATQPGLGAINISSTGQVGIGLINPSQALDVNGNIAATSFIYTSDEKLKKNISSLLDSVEKINLLNGVRFNWKKDNSEDIGLIAQDVEKVEPSLVVENKEGTKFVKYGNIMALVVENLKKNNSEIEKLKSEINELKQKCH